MKNLITRLPVTLCLFLVVLTAGANERSILVQSTTSTANSGLYDHLLPLFTEQTGITVHVVAVGTGQAIRNASNCDADVLLAHAKSAEEKFVADGYGVKRFDLMYNDFVLVGPDSSAHVVEGATGIAAVFRNVASSKTLFASRGDDSGTHRKELSLWQKAGVDPVQYSGQWYRETGSGMGATLTTGLGMGALVLSDRATWISFGNKGNARILFEGDPPLFNQYGVTAVNPEVCPGARFAESNIFIEWLISAEGQEAIAEFSVAGQQLFFPNAQIP